MRKIIGRLNGKEIEMATNDSSNNLFLRLQDGSWMQMNSASNVTVNVIKKEIRARFNNLDMAGKITYDLKNF
ncbi:MAG: hypothetical protein WC516_06645 [Patescibacteria group bacterium]